MLCTGWIEIGNYFKPTPVRFQVPKGWPQPLYNFKENPLTKEGIELGRQLFYDTRLSKDGSNFLRHLSPAVWGLQHLRS